jgi:nitrate/TMAO reductase-like tetraheme cytochrome c subunit
MGKQNISTPRFPIFRIMDIKKLLPYLILLLITISIVMTLITISTAQTHMNSINSKEFQSNYESFNQILQSFVNDNGTVDYASIRIDPFNLDKFIILLIM